MAGALTKEVRASRLTRHRRLLQQNLPLADVRLRYSITSSEMASTVCGMLRPSPWRRERDKPFVDDKEVWIRSDDSAAGVMSVPTSIIGLG